MAQYRGRLVKGLFKGENLGRKIAKTWNREASSGAPCPYCTAVAGSIEDLRRHLTGQHNASPEKAVEAA